MADSQTNQPDIAAIAMVLENSRTQAGETLGELSAQSPVLLVFLRHAGCTFCRETLGDLAEARKAIEQKGTRIVLVHMGDTAALQRLLGKHGLKDLDRLCDPSQELYRAFGLKRGTFGQLFGFKVLWRGFAEGVLLRCGIGAVVDDSAQMPGVFFLHNGAILRRFRHLSAADRPDYLKFCTFTS